MRFERGFGAILAIALTFLLSLNLQAENHTTPAEISHQNLIWAGPPQISILPDGFVEARVQTTEACSGGEAFLGIVPDAAALSYPIFRVSATVTLADTNRILVRGDLKELEKERNDINGLAAKRGGQVILRVQLWAKTARLLDLALAYSRADGGEYRRSPAMIEGPLVDCVTDSSVVISCAWDQPVGGELEIGDGAQRLAFEAREGRLEIAVSGLRPDSLWTYQLHWKSPSGVSESQASAFRTAPLRGSPQSFRCAVLCDARGTFGGAEYSVEGVNYATLKALLNLAYTKDAAFILFPGDMISGSSSNPLEIEEQFRSYKRAIAPVAGRIPIYEGMGNHDQPSLWLAEGTERDYTARRGDEAGEVIFARHFVNPENGPQPAGKGLPPYLETVYSFDWGCAHFAMLNSNYFQKGSGEKVADLPGQLQGELRTEQLDWLENDLKAAREAGQKHLIVMAHEPAFPNGGHVQDGMWWNGKRPNILAIRDRFWRILCKCRVLAAFFGDEHNYSRTLIDARISKDFDYPVWQIITGGGGAPFYSQDTAVPWAGSVEAFYPLPHFCLLDINADEARLTVVSQEGLSIEQVDLLQK